ncbi:hypothetical protein J4437_02810, partial [Candidatus Woesearchaeota archaeon]|nr:hypothetical protein [Candidatus Woesearchaeota archaeon]
MNTRKKQQKKNLGKKSNFKLDFKLEPKIVVLLVFSLFALGLLWLNLSDLSTETWQKETWQKITGGVVLDSSLDNNLSIEQPDTSPLIIIPETNSSSTSTNTALPLEENITVERYLVVRLKDCYLNYSAIAKIEPPSSQLGIQAEATSTTCGTVSSSLTLTASVSAAETCFNFTAHNVALNCAGFTVTYGTGGGADDGIVNHGGYDNITLKNCNITAVGDIGVSNRAAFFNFSDNVIFTNNTIYTQGSNHNDCFRSEYGNDPLITNNTCYINGTAHNNAGFRIVGGLGGIISNNNITVYGTNETHGIAIDSIGGGIGTQNNTIIRNNIIYLQENQSSGDGITIGHNSTVTFNNITMYMNSTSNGIDYGTISYNNSLIEDNIIFVNGTYNIYGIHTRQDFTNRGLNRNNVTINSNNNNTGIDTGSEIVYNNTVGVTGLGDYNTGIYVRGSQANIQTNNVTVYGANNNYGLDSETSCCASGTNFTNNTLISDGTGANNSGLYIGNSGGNYYFNNTIRSLSGSYTIFDSNGSQGNDYISYSNTFGRIAWDEKETGQQGVLNLTTNATLVMGTGIFLENNIIGVRELNEMGFVNQSSNITFYGLTPSAGKQVFKNSTGVAVRCDDTQACNLTYIAQSTEVRVTINSFSNYTTYYEDVTPNVSNLIPALNYVTNTTLSVEIGANITDTNNVSSATANITLPNGTISIVTLSNGTGYNDKWNGTYTLDWLTGTYNVTFIATDSLGNINSTQTTNFTVKVGCGILSNANNLRITLDQDIVTNTSNYC